MWSFTEKCILVSQFQLFARNQLFYMVPVLALTSNTNITELCDVKCDFAR